MAAKSGFTPPGRLGNPDINFLDEPRLHPELRKALIAANFQDMLPAKWPTDLKELHPLLGEQHDATNAMYSMTPLGLPGDEHEPDVGPEEVTIDGPDGNKIILYVFRPVTKEPTPCVIYTHGGGMTIISTNVPPHMRWAKSMALKGVVAIVTDFRNAWSKEKHNPFPAGLNDCVAAVKWVDAHKSDLNISNIVLQGESGGGNLACATALRANREGWVDKIAGVYAYVPYVSGKYNLSHEEKLKQFPSMVENDRYIINCAGMESMSQYYSPGDMDKAEAWPVNATEKELKGLPPHILSMDELDPLRDDGLAYFRKLSAAGVKVAAEVNLGLPHGAALLFRIALNDAHEKILRQIVSFAKSL
ncbi:hypothetical protein PRZ48_004474 [Zasmidium cellare]|uniref:Alpha/beta hydrolase fold-3 domain-containing protein n=1 Tax=Zasmidium cellare TaxID=395010 RepID=A0ABR0EPR0_ZASCE|nr:hypothetical protein PRZ48_004474 [Zasmidium cellare]